MLRVIDPIIEITTTLRFVIDAIARKDADLARQIRRSWTSTAQNAAEGQRQRGAKSLNRFDDAMGSGRETHISLRMAVALGYIEAAPNEPLLERVDGVVAQLYRLANP